MEIEKPSASQEKFSARCSGVPCAPNTLFMAMCTYMNDTPSSVVEKYRVSRRGSANGSSAARLRATKATHSGRVGPARSMRRPALTESSIGSSAKSDISRPTTNSEAPSWSANSVVVMRAPTKARCPSAFRTTK